MKKNIHIKNQATNSINLEIKDKIIKTMGSVLEQSSRVFIVRIDLRFPLNVKHKKDSRVISRFFDSLKSKLKAQEKRNKKDKWINFLTYLAKDFSKPYKDGYRVVGCSQ